MIERRTLRRLKWAMLAVAVVVAAVLMTIVVATYRVAPLPAATQTGDPPSLPDIPERGGAVSDSAVLAAVARDPFRADRQRPPSRYLFPSERATAVARSSRVNAYSRLRLLGTVVVPGRRALAALQIQGQPPQLLHVGDQLEELELKLVSIEKGSATFAGTDTLLVLWLPGTNTEARNR